MKKIVITSILALITALVSVSCDNADFGDTNLNPNYPSIANTASLLTGAERSMSPILTATEPLCYVQYITNGQYPKETIYDVVNFEYTSNYVSILNNLQAVINLNKDAATAGAALANGSNNNQIAVAMILKAYVFQHITDRWGMVPYTGALQGLDNAFPKFDTQEAIYDGLFKDLTDAVALMDAGAGPKGDVIFTTKATQMSEWKRFANTLKLNMAMRLSKRFPAAGGYAATKFVEALNAGTIASNAQNFTYPYITDEAYDNPWEDRFETRTDYLVSEPFVNLLIGTGTNLAPQDPRLAKFAEKAANGGGIYKGGLTSAVGNTTVANYSFITNTIIKNKTAPAFFYTYAQVSFAKAEAASLGWIPGSAATFYAEGIRASMAQWGVATATADAYVLQFPYVNLKSIAYQKHIALYMQGYEGWNEWRRFGNDAVALTVPAGAIGSATIPQRQAYGASVKTLNLENYNAAIATQGADKMETKVWWAN
ncbi:SusD/RagB family nutrient-binding outer membrane lipoprotein [Flavobacterium sp. 245]|uniref:SusD/RagB family nutrient-binding outer membrane lipoprotein n=1 Tax=Flavobacterium sp. 245 TaxID=2512115 RepID=UPI0010D2D138|nr:SusD/RagB family nutrient-binding outer membrane lipoprotein [Flavobacterium sp. 245]TDP01698.1 SusD-like starch-binding protein associating with outer membrane [Flavobacterium sp. 245]